MFLYMSVKAIVRLEVETQLESTCMSQLELHNLAINAFQLKI